MSPFHSVTSTSVAEKEIFQEFSQTQNRHSQYHNNKTHNHIKIIPNSIRYNNQPQNNNTIGSNKIKTTHKGKINKLTIFIMVKVNEAKKETWACIIEDEK
jgi:hypothetical protein